MRSGATSFMRPFVGGCACSASCARLRWFCISFRSLFDSATALRTPASWIGSAPEPALFLQPMAEPAQQKSETSKQGPDTEFRWQRLNQRTEKALFLLRRLVRSAAVKSALEV